MKVVMIILPAFAIVFFVAVKLPGKYKNWFFKVPIWISSTAFGLIVGHFMRGVMGPMGALLCDFMLMPMFSLIKMHHDWTVKRKAIREERENQSAIQHAPSQYIPPGQIKWQPV